MATTPTMAPEAWLKYTRAVENAVKQEATPRSINEVLEAYMDLPGREGKSAGRKFLDDYVVSAVDDGDNNRARICSAIRKVAQQKRWKTDRGVPPRVAVHTEKYLDLLTALQKAYGAAVHETPPELRKVMPENFWENLDDNIDDVIVYRRWMTSDPKSREAEPKVSEVDKQAARISLGRSPGTAGRPIPTTKVNKK
ncbi:hypothetical protein SEA_TROGGLEHUMPER_94 [Rhodococcus phage Trogglehumper]|uniref:Uncharacterized protein n=1 Tax=Rhodococcus phage Trogglehumper TaxID=3038381 RepID=A0AAF0GK53_9CAUD|nr:hypothetical protein SEA_TROGGLEHUMPER_94 [Rhodococcus phage Trogglehumper]